MGLDMYLKCNHRELVEEVFGKRVEWGYEHKDYDDFHRRYGTICYWRKANAIHNWFVENVQDGEDDCRSYDVSLDDLAELRKICKHVLNASKLVKSMVQNGSTLENGKWVPIMQEGFVIEDPSVADKLLPTTDGFFFGSTGYDQWYYHDIEETYRTLDLILSKFEPDENGSYGWEQTYGDTDWVVRFEYYASW